MQEHTRWQSPPPKILIRVVASQILRTRDSGAFLVENWRSNGRSIAIEGRRYADLERGRHESLVENKLTGAVTAHAAEGQHG